MENNILRFQGLGRGPHWGTIIVPTTLTTLPPTLYMAKPSNEFENIIFSVRDKNFELLSSGFKVTQPARGRIRIQSS